MGGVIDASETMFARIEFEDTQRNTHNTMV